MTRGKLKGRAPATTPEVQVQVLPPAPNNHVNRSQHAMSRAETSDLRGGHYNVLKHLKGRFVQNGKYVFAQRWPGDLSEIGWAQLGVFHRQAMEEWEAPDFEALGVRWGEICVRAGQKGLGMRNAWAWLDTREEERGSGEIVEPFDYIVTSEETGEREAVSRQEFADRYELADAGPSSEHPPTIEHSCDRWRDRFGTQRAAQEHNHAAREKARVLFWQLIERNGLRQCFGVKLAEHEDDMRVTLDGDVSRQEFTLLWAHARAANDLYIDLLAGTRKLDE